jgi:hypothetical protein
MKNRKRLLAMGIFAIFIIFPLCPTITDAKPNVYHGKVVSTEGKVIQVKGDDGKVSVFWLGHRTKLDSRAPFFGDRVRIEYVKDKLNRNAVTRVTILGK